MPQQVTQAFLDAAVRRSLESLVEGRADTTTLRVQPSDSSSIWINFRRLGTTLSARTNDGDISSGTAPSLHTITDCPDQLSSAVVDALKAKVADSECDVLIQYNCVKTEVFKSYRGKLHTTGTHFIDETDPFNYIL